MNQAANKLSVSLLVLLPAILLLSLSIACIASAGGIEQQICDVGADYSLGVEDYPQTIRLHNEVVRKHPDNALAHYHLGFLQGMMGNGTAEVSEYKRASALGLRNWDLFLNLGLAQLEDGDLDAAIDSLRQAVLRGQNHPESHFNLALVYERRGRFANAEREMLASLRLDPEQPDARNLLGVIYTEEGKTACASLLWRELVHEAPYCEPALQKSGVTGQPQGPAYPWLDGGRCPPGGRRRSHPTRTQTTFAGQPKYGGNRRNQAESKYHGSISSK